jgi:hypothetical protein
LANYLKDFAKFIGKNKWFAWIIFFLMNFI